MADIASLLAQGSQARPVSSAVSGEQNRLRQLQMQAQTDLAQSQADLFRGLAPIKQKAGELGLQKTKNVITQQEQEIVKNMTEPQREKARDIVNKAARFATQVKAQGGTAEDLLRGLSFYENFDTAGVAQALSSGMPLNTVLDMIITESDEFNKLFPMTKEKETKKSDLVAIQTPDGPKYVKASEAVGKKPLPKKGISLTTAAGDVIEIGGEPRQGLDKKVIRDEQTKVINAANTIRRLDNIKTLVKPEYFTYQSALGAKIDRVKAKLGGTLDKKDMANLKGRRRMANAIDQEFNQYRKEITGAAAAIQELERLKESFINSDLSYPEFQAAFDEYRNKQVRALQIAQDLLKKGIPLGSKEFTKAHDNAWLSAWPGDVITAPNGQRVKIIQVDPNGDHIVEPIE